MNKQDRLKVFIRCNQCGENFILRGTKEGKGTYGTGFKRCVCNNENDFNIRSEVEQPPLP
ncbi:hypothetical protein [Caldalkalibacillus salinus]|uniref:hypothetical protein n=1 Tax=Caldalkalibacillus salinus TaxID=2803787 RepID=UPI001920C1AB|nr:hypothetical protein [Caldalkalibacillus salinus]